MTEVATLRAPEPPMSVEAEQNVLGTCLLRPERIGAVVIAGGADLFGDPLHADMFRLMAERDREGLLVSPVTMAEVLRDEARMADVGGPGYLVRMAGVASNASFDGYIDFLKDFAARRTLCAALSEAQAAVARNEGAAGEIAARLELAIHGIVSQRRDAKPVTMAEAATAALQAAHAAYQGEDDGSVKADLPSLDRLMGGFFPGDLVLLGGRPSMGKTALALSLAINAGRRGHHVAFASFEMLPEAVALRAVSDATATLGRGIDYKSIRAGAFTEADGPHIARAAEQVARLPITFLPPGYRDLGALIAGMRQIKRRMGDALRLVVVDYAQIIRTPGKDRYNQVTEISTALKGLAMDLRVPVIALSQLSRSLENREDKRPQLSDLRESGQLEQDADAVMFCFREAYYLERERPDPDNVEDCALWNSAMEKARSLLEVIVAKNRQGQIGTANLRANLATNTVWEDRQPWP